MNTTVIFTHGDCDGMVSGAIALVANPGAKIWFTNPVSIDKDLKSFKDQVDRIIILDIALNDKSLQATFESMMRIRKMGIEIIYIDHHPLPEGIKSKQIPANEVVHKLEGSTSELAYLFFESKLTWKHKILAAIGSVGDYEMNTIFTQEVFRDYDARSIAFQAAIIVQALGEIPDEENLNLKRSIVERLALGIMPSEIHSLVNKALQGCLVESSVREYVHKNTKVKQNLGFILDIPTGGGFNGKGALFAATAVNKPVGICGNSIGDKISSSIRRRDERVDLNKIVRIAAKLAGGTGGGHPSAAGATIDANKWYDFLELLDKEIENYVK